jgi:hypothetical protein
MEVEVKEKKEGEGVNKQQNKMAALLLKNKMATSQKNLMEMEQNQMNLNWLRLKNRKRLQL